ncbi:MAG: N-acetyltransferase [Sumerlaeia bacterium]
MLPSEANIPDRSQPIRIVKCRTPRAVDVFCDFVYKLRGSEPRWVPPLRRDQRTLLDRLKHPFHDHAQVEYFLAKRGERIVGRIAAIENFAHNEVHNERIGFFGFLEAEDDAEVFARLLAAAERWAKARGLTALRGPCSFSTNEECGALVGGFDIEPILMMGYHHRCYSANIEAAGYGKAEDLLCFWVDRYTDTERLMRMARSMRQRIERSGRTFTTRPLDKKNFEAEVQLVQKIYNAAWEKNWGFVPMTEKEIDFLAKELKPIATPELIRFALLDGEPVGLVLGLLNYNEVLKFMRGRLGPKEIAMMLLLKSRIRSARMMMLGVLPEYRRLGIDILLIEEFGYACEKLNIWGTDLSWILERNTAITKVIIACGGREWKRYRLYEKSLLG